MKTPTPRTDDFLSRNSSYMEKRAYMMELERKLTAMTEQRDGLQKIVDEQCRFSSVCCEYREQRDEARQKIENQAERITYLEGATNHANGTPLTKAIEQRDRLAEALRKLCEALLTDKPRDITELLNKAGDALQSLTTPTQTEPE